MHIDPGAVAFGHDASDFAGAGISQNYFIRILQAIESLQDQLARIGSPLHLGHVVIARVARQIEPAGRTAVGAHDADPAGGVCLACLRVGEPGELWVQTGRVVHQHKLRHAFGIELPVGDRFAVRTPAPGVAQIKFFFVHPVGCTVDDGAGAVLGKWSHFAVSQIFHIYIVGADIAGARAVRRQLGKHQAAGRGIAAKPGQLAGLAIEHPEIAARVLPPHALRIGENQQQTQVFGKMVIFYG